MSVEAREGSYVQPRRHILRFFCSLAFACHFPVWRCEPPKPATQPREARGFGDNLSLAALLYNQGAAAATVNQVLSKAKAIADILGMEIKPFPAKSGTAAAASADVIHYLIEGDGALIGPALTRKYDAEHGTLFEVAVKSNLLILLYAPGERTAQSIATVIKTRLESIRLPATLWTDVVTLVNNKRPQGEVKDAVFKMHKDIANYFIPGSG
jgi:hypothetical protein